jgi:hypothetical protein
MDNKQHNKDNNLEDFLRKSFDSFEPNPSDTVWDKIEETLNVPVNSTPPRISLNMRWLIGAAAAMLCIFTCQQFYFQNQISHLQKQVEKQQQEIKLQTNKQNSTPNNSEAVASNPKTTPNQSTDAPGSNKPFPAPANMAASSPTNPVAQQNTLQEERSHTNQISHSEGHTAHGILSQEQLVDRSPVIQQSSTEGEFIPVNSEDKNEVKSMESLALLDQPFRYISTSENRSIPGPKTIENLPVAPKVKSRDWALGVFTMPVFNSTKVVTTQSNAPGPFNKPSSSYTARGNGFYSGVLAERKLPHSLSLVSGLAYQQQTVDAKHTTNFKFSDRRPPHHGGGHHPPHQDFEHQFDYDLPTNTGTVEVQVRVAEQDSNFQIPDSEDLEINTYTSQTSKSLSVPVLLKYELGSKKHQFAVKSGGIVNFLLQDKLNLNGYEVNNPHLEILASDPASQSTVSRDKMGLDLFVSAGWQAQLTPQLRLGLEPSVVFNQSQPSNSVNVKQTQFGLNANLSILF